MSSVPAIGSSLYYRTLVPGLSIPKIAAVWFAKRDLWQASSASPETNRRSPGHAGRFERYTPTHYFAAATSDLDADALEVPVN